MSTLRSVAAWFMPVVPEARVAILRTVLYLFVIIDIHLFVRDPIPLSRHPELYQPLMIERLFQLPPPSVPLDNHALPDLDSRLSGSRGKRTAPPGRCGGGCSLHLVDGDRHELREGRP